MKLVTQTATHKTSISCKENNVKILTEVAKTKIVSSIPLTMLYDFVKKHLSTRSRSPGVKRRALTIKKGELALLQEAQIPPSPNPSSPR